MPSRLREVVSASRAEESAPKRQSSRNKSRKSYAMETDSDDFEEDDDDDDDAAVGEDADASDVPTSGRTTNRRAAARRAREGISSLRDSHTLDIDDGDEDADDGVPLGASKPSETQGASLKLNAPAAQSSTSKAANTAAEQAGPKIKSVETKEMEMNDDDEDDDDDELSELGSDNEDEMNGDDAEGEEDEEMDEEEDAEGEEEDEDDMDDEEDASRDPYNDGEGGSRASTPDVTKLTKRQRGRIDQVDDGNFLQLPMEPQIKKHLTAEEHAMRRAEMARRRKNLSEKRNEEEMTDTVNRLLKKQATKRRGKISQAEIAAQDRDDDEQEGGEVIVEAEEQAPPNPIFVRWKSTRQGSSVSVPVEWEGTPEGRLFWAGAKQTGVGDSNGKLVSEVKS